MTAAAEGRHTARVTSPDQGQLVGSGGFRIDRSRALTKLSAFQLHDKHHAVLALVRCAVASGATQIRIETGRRLVLSFDGQALSAAELEDPFAALFMEESGAENRSRQLAIGLLGALGASSAGLTLEGGEGPGRRSLRIASAADFEGAPVAGEGKTETILRIKGRLADVVRLRTDCWACPIPIFVDGANLPRGRKPEEPGVYFEEEGRYGFVSVPADPYAGSKLRLHVLGVRIGDSDVPTGAVPVEGYVNDDGFVLNASQSAVVRNERFAAMARAVSAAAKKLVVEASQSLRQGLPVTARIMEVPFFAAAWRQAVTESRENRLFERGLLGRAYIAAQRAMGASPEVILGRLSRLRWEADCCRWLRHLAKTGDRSPEVRAAPLFITANGRTASLEHFERWAKEGRRIQGWKGLSRSGAPESIWCSTATESADLRALVPEGLDIQ